MQERIKQARDRAGLSLRQAAGVIGVSHVTIDKWETEGAPEARVAALAEAYGVSQHWIRTGLPAGDVSDVAKALAKSRVPPEEQAKIMEWIESSAAA